jgi:hypothetical protein
MANGADLRPAMLNVRHGRLRFPLLASSAAHHFENRSRGACLVEKGRIVLLQFFAFGPLPGAARPLT